MGGEIYLERLQIILVTASAFMRSRSFWCMSGGSEAVEKNQEGATGKVGIRSLVCSALTVALK